MPVPRLLHPVPVVIQQLDKAATIMDDDYREPIQKSVRNAAITLNGQVNWDEHQTFQMKREGGATLASDGYVLFLYKDLNAAGVALKTDDRFTTIGGLEVDLYIVKIRPIGHYSAQKGPTMVKAFFVDRQPAKQGLGIDR